MEQMIHLAKQIYTQQSTAVVLVLLGCIFLLAIISLVGIRRCRRQILRLTENTKEMTKAVFAKNAETVMQDEHMEPQEQETSVDPKKRDQRDLSHMDEELFGSVIQEIFP